MSARRYIIGLCGPMGSGKTMAAMHLADTHEFTRMRFADPLKRMLREMGLNAYEIDGNLKEKPCDLICGETPRRAMQLLGTEFGRRLHPDLWVNIWKQSLPDNENVVVDDVRFPNEVKAIRDVGGSVIRICRDGHDFSTEHVSEHEVECDYMLGNNGRPEDLYDQLDHWIWFEEAGL